MHEAEFAMTRFVLIDRSIKNPEAHSFGVFGLSEKTAHCDLF